MSPLSVRNNVFVTNADTGVGSCIVRELCTGENKHHFSCVGAGIHDMEFAGGLWEMGAHPIEVKNNDEQRVEEYLKGANILVLVLNPGSGDMVKNAESMIHAAKGADVENCLMLSLVGADESDNELARNYKSVEESLQNSGIQNTRVVRKGFMSNLLFLWAPWVRKYNKLPLSLLGGTAKFAPLDLCDMALFVSVMCCPEGDMFKAKKRGEVLNLTGVELFTPQSLIEKMNSTIGTKIAYEQVEPSQTRDYFTKELCLPQAQAQTLLWILDLVQRGNYEFTSNDHKKTIGRDPAHFDRFIKEHASSFLPEKQG